MDWHGILILQVEQSCNICLFFSKCQFFSARNSSVDGWYNLRPNLGFFAGTTLWSSRTSFLSQCLHLLSSKYIILPKNLSHSELKTLLVRAKNYNNGNKGHVPF